MSKKNSFKPDIQIEDYGISISNPVLLSSIRAGYSFCNRLKNLDDGLEYSRRGSNSSPGFDKPIDVYDFKHFGKAFCTVYIYVYHSENIEEVPEAFIKLGEEDVNLDHLWEALEITDEGENDSEEIFQALMLDETENLPPREELFDSLVRNILTKQSKELWGENDDEWLKFQIQELGVSPVIEPLILQECEDYFKKTHRPHLEFFVLSFLSSYHNSKLSPFLPGKVQKQNLEVEEAYTRLLNMINNIQFRAGEDLRGRIESEPGDDQGDLSLLKQCTTKFCALQLHTHFSGSNHIDFWLDADIFEMLNIKPANSFLRSIYELTPGLGEHITCRSFAYDCEAWFKVMKEETKYGDGHQFILATFTFETNIQN